MTIVVYHKDHIYSDSLFVDKLLAQSSVTWYHGDKIYQDAQNKITIGFTGNTLTNIELAYIQNMFFKAMVVEAGVVSSKIKRSVSGEDIAKYVLQKNKVDQISDAADALISSCIVGYKNYVYTFYRNDLEKQNHFKRIDKDDTYCIGSDAVEVYCLIKSGLNPKEAIVKASQTSSLISDQVHCVELEDFNSDVLDYAFMKEENAN